MTARRAIVFISIAAILAGVFSLSAAVLTRWMANVPPAAPLDVPLASLSLPLDAQGLGTQVIEGTSLTFRVQPYPPVARSPVTITLVAIGPGGVLVGDDELEPGGARAEGEQRLAGEGFVQEGAGGVEVGPRAVVGQAADQGAPRW